MIASWLSLPMVGSYDWWIHMVLPHSFTCEDQGRPQKVSKMVWLIELGTNAFEAGTEFSNVSFRFMPDRFQM